MLPPELREHDRGAKITLITTSEVSLSYWKLHYFDSGLYESLGIELLESVNHSY